MTSHAQRAVDGAYAAHGDAATWQAPGAPTPVDVRVIDNIAEAILAASADDRPGMVALNPRVNVRVSELATSEPESGTLVLKGRTWTVLSSILINEFERELTLEEVDA